MSMSFMDSLLVEVNKATMQKETLPLLSSLQQHAIAIVDWLVNLLPRNKLAWLLNWLRRLVVLTGLHSGHGICVTVLKQIMTKEPHPRLPTLFTEVQSQVEQQFPGVVEDVLDALMADIGMSCQPPFHSKWLLTNLHSLLLIEKDSPKQLARSSCMGAIRTHISTLASLLLSTTSLASTILQILLLLFGQNFSLSLSAELALCQSCCSFYFSVLCDNQSPPSGNRLWCLQQCKTLLAVITRRSTAQFLVVRLVIEKLIELGSELSKLPTTSSDLSLTSLLEANRKQDSSLGRRQISRAFSQASQATVAGQALLHCQRSERQRMHQSITQWAIDLVYACCTDPVRPQQKAGVKVTSSGANSIATALVDLTAPVCIHPGGWPTDDESLKWTLEKDLMVKRYFQDHPVLWQLLLMAAPVSGALSMCRPVIASLLASQVSFWKHCRHRLTKQAESELQATISTVQAITQAGWLPSQAESLPHWLSFLTPDETCRLLLAVMQHIRCSEQIGNSHKKSNGAFDALLDTVRNVLQANIGKLGYLYPTVAKR
jgi:integrator complex subunit 5